MKPETMLWIAGGIGAFVLINGMTKGKAAQLTGEAVGSTAGGIVGGVPKGIVVSYLETLQSARDWSNKQEDIPVIDWVAKPIGTAFGNFQTFVNATDKVAWLKRVSSQTY